MVRTARRAVHQLAYAGAVVAHQWMVIAVLIAPTIIGCATVLLLAYSVNREHRQAVIKDLAGTLSGLIAGAERPSWPRARRTSPSSQVSGGHDS